MAGPQPADPLLTVEKIRKAFGHVVALREISLDIYGHEILALLGDNGAGKSTLVKVISGLIKPDSGSLQLEGRQVSYASPAEARRAGIETVYQDLALVDKLPIWRNFFLGKELMTGPLAVRRLDARSMRRACMESLVAMGIVDIPSPDILVSDLSGGQRQAVAIARAVHRGARMLILDEPTAALGVHATQQVYRAIRATRDQGSAVVVISHDIGEIYEIADRLAIIEQGRVLATYARAEVSLDTVINQLLRRHVAAAAP
jgi:simple sugar transport system ATP-binding protein